MDYIYCDPEDVDIPTVAARFCCSVADIINATQASGDWAVAALNGTHDALPPDGTRLQIPTPPAAAPCSKLPSGAQWLSWTATADGSLAALLMTLQRGPSDTDKPLPTPGRLIDGDITSVTQQVWHYYANSDLRREAMKANRLKDENYCDAQIEKDTSLLVPVLPPERIESGVAPSPHDSTMTSGTIDVDEGRQYAELFARLHDLERTIDDVDALRGGINSYALAGNNLVQSFLNLRESMEKRAADVGDGPLKYDAYDRNFKQDNIHRTAAIEAMDKLLGASQKAILGQPVWTNFLESKQLLTDLPGAIDGVRAKIKDARMMELLVELFPAGYAMPLTTSKGERTRLASYVCILAARAVGALDEKWETGELVGELETYVREETKKAGSACKNIIEYGCACIRGFEGNDIVLRSPAAHSLFGVVLAVYTVKPYAEAAAASEAEAPAKKMTLQSVLKLVFGKLAPLIKATTGKDWATDEIGLELKEKMEPFSLIHEGIEGAQKGMSKLPATKEAAEKLEAVLSPFKEEVGVLRELVPERLRSVSKFLGMAWDMTASVSGVVGAVQAGAPRTGTVQQMESVFAAAGAVTGLAKTTTGAARDVLKTRQAISYVTEASMNSAVDILGKWTTVLGIAVSGCKVIEDVDAADASFASRMALTSHLTTLTGSLLFLFATPGGPVFVVLGGAFLTAGFLIEHKDIIVNELKGDTVAKFNALNAEPSVASTWATRLKFKSRWDEFVAAFGNADFATPKKLVQDLKDLAKGAGEAANEAAEALGQSTKELYETGM